MQKTGNRTPIVPIEQVTTFYTIAFASYLGVERLVEQRSRYEQTVKQQRREWTEEDVDYLARNGLTPADEDRSAVVTVIFSALTLEALINDYAVSRFSKWFLTRYLDTLNAVSKWLIVPWVAVGTRFSTGGKTMEVLKKLFGLRNKLVHFKTTHAPTPDAGKKDRLTKAHAAEAIDAVRRAVDELTHLDPSVSNLWLSQCEELCAEEG